MSNELLEALNILEQEKNISKETLLEAIENSLVTACKNHFGKSDNVKVEIDPETCAFSCYQEKTVVDTVEDPVEEISLADAHKVNGNYQLGDIVRVEVKSKEFGRYMHDQSQAASPTPAEYRPGYTERKECYPSENPRGGEKGNI